MIHDPNQDPAQRAARRQQDEAFARQREWAKDDYERRFANTSAGKQGGVLAFIVIIALIALGAYMLMRR